jgi:hypothetical protein
MPFVEKKAVTTQDIISIHRDTFPQLIVTAAFFEAVRQWEQRTKHYQYSPSTIFVVLLSFVLLL